jgi:hypothetical protein
MPPALIATVAKLNGIGATVLPRDLQGFEECLDHLVLLGVGHADV